MVLLGSFVLMSILSNQIIQNYKPILTASVHGLTCLQRHSVRSLALLTIRVRVSCVDQI